MYHDPRDTILGGPGGPGDRARIELAAKSGWPIPNVRVRELVYDQLAEALRMDSTHTSARLRSITGTYNCVGMAFASRRVYVDAEHLAAVLREDGYARIDVSSVEPGDVVTYRMPESRPDDFEHMGIVWSTFEELAPGRLVPVITVMSKWGRHGEYIHRVEDVPARFGSTIEYWTERKALDAARR